MEWVKHPFLHMSIFCDSYHGGNSTCTPNALHELLPSSRAYLLALIYGRWNSFSIFVVAFFFNAVVHHVLIHVRSTKASSLFGVGRSVTFRCVGLGPMTVEDACCRTTGSLYDILENLDRYVECQCWKNREDNCRQ